MNSTTSATLLEQLREGTDPLAWEEFFERYWRLVYACARHQGCSPHTAEEIVQEVMLTVYEKRDVFRYDPTRGRFRDWLGGVVRNKVALHRRSASERVCAQGGEANGSGAEPADPHPTAETIWQETFERVLLAALLETVRRQMNPRTFQAFELFVLDELPGRDVARIIGVSRNAVYQARRAVCQRLRELGAAYRKDGQLGREVREAMALLPDTRAERSVSRRVSESMRQRAEPACDEQRDL